MKEVIFPKRKDDKKEYGKEKCSCGGRVYSSQIPCPEGVEGCLAIHYGFTCEKCGKHYQ